MHKQILLYLLLVMVMVFTLPAGTSAQIQATAGSGVYRNNIYWLNFNGVSMAAGQTLTRNFKINGIDVTVVIDNLTFSGAPLSGTLNDVRLVSYISGTWVGDRLNYLYRIPNASDPNSNTMQIGLATNVNGRQGVGLQANYRVRAYATISGQPADIGLVFANAESDANNEYTQGTTNGTNWQLLEKGAFTPNGNRSITFSNADKTARLQCDGNVGLLYTYKILTGQSNPLQINAQFVSGGKTAIAMGVIAYTDIGDAPASYGKGASVISPVISGGNDPTPGTSSTVYLLNPPAGGTQINAGVKTNPVTPRLGPNAADDDPGNFTLGTNADADDKNNIDDEDGISSIPTLLADAGNYTLQATAFKNTTPATIPANIYAWIDLNRDGVFSANEAVTATLTDNNTTVTIPLTWSFKATDVQDGLSYVRVRITHINLVDDPSTQDIDERSTGTATGGETEDYPITIRRVCDLSLKKTSSPNPVVVGQPLTYTITLTNGGPSPVLTSDVLTVNENLPDGFTAQTYTPSAGTYNSSDQTWTGLSLDSGQRATLVIKGTVSDNASGQLINSASVSTPPNVTDPGNDNNTVSDTTTLTRRLDYGITKTGSPKPATAGAPFTYTITVTNNGPSTMMAGDIITLTESLPNGFTVTGYQPDAGSFDSSNGKWSGLLLAKGESARLTIQGNIDPAYTSDSIVNTVTLTPPAGTVDSAGKKATDSTAVQRLADVGLAKTASPDKASAGDSLTYTITLSNNGPSSIVPADVLAITEGLPAGFTPSGYTSSSGTYNNKKGEWSGLQLAEGQSATLKIAGVVNPDASGSLTNKVSVKLPGDIKDTNSTNDTASVTIPVQRKLNYGITKLGSPKPATAGESFTYTIRLINNGPASMIAGDTVVLQDTLPQGFTADSYTASAGSFNSTGGQWTGLLLAKGQSATLTIKGKIDPAYKDGSLVNTVAVVPPQGTDSDTPASASDTTAVNRQMALQLEKKADPKPASAGQPLRYTIKLTNNGPSGIGTNDTTTVKDQLPDGFTATGYTPETGSYNNATGAWTGFALAPGNSITLVIAGTVKPDYTGGTLENTVTASPPAGTSGSPPVSAGDTTKVVRRADLAVTKTGSPKPAIAGDTLTYTIRLINNGPASLVPADVVYVSDKLPDAYRGTAFITSSGNFNNNNGEWKGLSLASGESATLTINGRVSAAASGNNLVNKVTVYPPAGVADSVFSNNDAADTTPIQKIADLAITKTDGKTAYTPGKTTTYTVVATNAGPSDVQGAVVADPLPAGITDASWSCTAAGGAVVPATSGTGAINQVVDIPKNGKITYIFKLNIPSSFTGNLVNRASVTAPPDYTEPDKSNNEASDTDTSHPQYNLVAVKKGPASGDVVAGDNISYTVSYTNNGPSDLQKASFADNVPQAVKVNNWTVATAGNASSSVTSGTGNAVRFTGSIAAGSGNSITVTINGTVDPSASGTMRNTATVTPDGDTTVPSNTTSTTVTRNAGINIVKTGPDGDTVLAGNTIRYHIKVTNLGPSDEKQLLVTDSMPSVLTNVSWKAVASGGAAINGGSPLSGTGNIRFTGSVPAGSGNEFNIDVTATVPPSTPDGSITNTATATPSNGSPVSSDVTVDVYNMPSIVIVKSGPASVAAGEPVMYTLEVTNNGPSDALNATISDEINAGVHVTGWQAVAKGATIRSGATGTGNMVEVKADIPAGEGHKITVTINGTVDPTAEGKIDNTAVVSIPGHPDQPSNTVETTVDNNATLVFSKTGPDTISAGSIITYTLVLTNTGTSNANNVRVTDLLPAEVLYPAITDQRTSGHAGILNAGIVSGGGRDTLAAMVYVGGGPGNSVSFQVSGWVNPDYSGKLSNSATAKPPGKPSTQSNTLETNVKNDANITIVKSGPSDLSGGDDIAYTITVANNGPSNAKGIVIDDSIPAGILNPVWTVEIEGDSIVVSNTEGTGNVHLTADIPASKGAAVVIRIKGRIDPAFSGKITNTATAAVSGKAPVAAQVNTKVTNNPVVQVVKSGPSAVSAGQAIQYTLLVTNTGKSTAMDMVIADSIPAGITNVSWTAAATGTGTVISAGSGTGNVLLNSTLPPGADHYITIDINGVVDPSYTGKPIQNTASATPGSKSTVPSNPVQTTVSSDPELHIVKSGPDQANAGESITYQLLVTNTGPSNATGARILDSLPAGFTNISWTATASGDGTTVSAASGAGPVLNITADIPTGPGHQVLISITGTISSSSGGRLKNIATAGVPGKPVSSDSHVTTVNNQANVHITKSGPSAAIAGQPVTYTLVVTNAGPSDARNVLITDKPARELKNITWVASANGNGTSVSTTSGKDAVNLTGNLPAGAGNTITVTISADLPADYTGTSLQNTATAAVPGQPADSSSVTTPVKHSADLRIVKSGPQTIAAGEQVVYRILVSNAGPSDVAGAVIKDDLPAGLDNISWTAVPNGEGTAVNTTSGTGSIDITAAIPAGGDHTVAIEVRARLKPGTAAGSITNTATASPPPGVDDPSPAISTVNTAVRREADLVIVKIGPADLAAGQSISYRLVVSNNGPSDVNGLTIKDVIPGAIQNISYSTSVNGTASIGVTGLSGNTLTVNGDIAAGKGNLIIVDIKGIVDPAAPAGEITNRATVAMPDGIRETDPSSNSSSVTTKISKDVGVSISKSGPASANIGDPISYTVAISNTGASDAGAVDITDHVPSGVTGVTWTAVASGNGGTRVYQDSGSGNYINFQADIEGVVNGPGTVLLTIHGTVSHDAGTSITNTAIAEFEGTRSSSFTTAVNNTADLRIIKSGPAVASAGEQVAYNITVTNAGPADVRGATITDQLPEQLTAISWTATASGGAVVGQGEGSGNQININADIPAATGSVSIDITGTINPAFTGKITNTAQATPPRGVTDPTPARSAVETQVNNTANLLITKSGPDTVIAGNPVTYTILISNNGPSDANGITISDQVPGELKQTHWTAIATGTGAAVLTGASGNGNAISVTGNLPAVTDCHIFVTITGVVDSSFAGTISNTASATTKDGPPVTSAPVNTGVVNKPDLTIVKSGPAEVAAGAPVVYTIRVANNGPSNASGVQITDMIPPQIKNVSWTVTASGTGTSVSTAGGNGNAISLTGNIAAGNGNNILITVNGLADPAFSGPVANTASATAPGAKPVSRQVNTLISNQADIRIVKSGPTAINAGQQIVYTLQLTNQGPSNAANIIVRDDVPGEIQQVQWTATTTGTGAVINSGSTGTGNNLLMNVGIPAAPGSRIDVTITGIVPADYTGTFSNTASATPPGGEPVNSAPIITRVDHKAALYIHKSGPSTAGAGQEITYVIEAGNNGPSMAKGVMITDSVPAAIHDVQWTAIPQGDAVITTGAAGTGTAMAVRADIAAGSGNKVIITVKGTIDPGYGGLLKNLAKIIFPDPAQPIVSTDSVPTQVQRIADISVKKQGPPDISAGGQIYYTIDVANHGPAAANGIIIHDQVPAQINVTSWQAVVVAGDAVITGPSGGSGNTIAVKADMPANSYVRINIAGIVNQVAATSLSNTATLTLPPGVTDPTPDTSSTVTTNLRNDADLFIVKQGAQNIHRGALVTYRIQVGNNGPSAVSGTGFTDLMPAGISNISAHIISQDGGAAGATVQVNGRQVTGTINLLPSGALVNIEITGNADGPGPLINKAYLQVPPGITGNNTHNDTTAVVTGVNMVSGADLVVTKKVTKAGPHKLAGHTGYEIVVTNKGPDTATGIVVTDSLPKGLAAPEEMITDRGMATFDPASRVITWRTDQLGRGETMILRYSNQITGSGTLVNKVTATANEPDPDKTSDTATGTIVVNDDLFIPNTVTANGDGKNDVFRILGLDRYPGSPLAIYNRWGNEVYHSNNYQNDWDGRGLSEGTYYYILSLRLPQGGSKLYKGWILLIH